MRGMWVYNLFMLFRSCAVSISCSRLVATLVGSSIISCLICVAVFSVIRAEMPTTMRM